MTPTAAFMPLLLICLTNIFCYYSRPEMSPQTRNSINTTKNSTGPDTKPTLSQLERHVSLERGKRVCIVCGKLSPINSSIFYPRGRTRRKEFDTALGLPSHVSDALPAGCYICSTHFNPNDLDLSTGSGPIQISDFALPSLDLDHEFLRELCSLKKDEVEPKSAIRLVKSKLDWDMKPPLLTEQENSYESDEANTLVSNLFSKLNKPNRQLGKRQSNSHQLPTASKSIRLVPVSRQTLQFQTPPILEKMDDTIEEDQPPTLSPVIRKSQRTKMPVLEASTSSTTADLDKKDQIIQRLRQALNEKSTELDLLKKKLRITEELLQFYQKNHKSNDYEEDIEELPPLLMAGQSSFATVMITEGNQSELLQKFLKQSSPDE